MNTKFAVQKRAVNIRGGYNPKTGGGGGGGRGKGGAGR